MTEEQMKIEEIAAATPARVLPPKITAHKAPPSKKERVFQTVRLAVLLLLSSFAISFASYCIIAPNKFAIGGVSGIAIILEKVLGLSQSITVLCINVPLLIAAFFFVKRKFAILSLINVIMQSLWIVLLETVNAPRLEFTEQIFAALAGGIGIGTGIGLAFKLGGSTGGMDIVAVMVQKKFPAHSIAWMIFMLSCGVIGASFFVYRDPQTTLAVQLLPIIKATTEQYVESRVNDALANGFQSALEFRVVTDKPEELSYELISRLGRGVSASVVTGMYTHEHHTMLICVIHRRQVAAFRKILKEVDPHSFAVMSHVSQVLGLGFFSSER